MVKRKIPISSKERNALAHMVKKHGLDRVLRMAERARVKGPGRKKKEDRGLDEAYWTVWIEIRQAQLKGHVKAPQKDAILEAFHDDKPGPHSQIDDDRFIVRGRKRLVIGRQYLKANPGLRTEIEKRNAD
jgi:hypothetical protein